MRFPKMKKNEVFLRDLSKWINEHSHWFSQGWQVQAVIQLNEENVWQIIFLHFYPTVFTGILNTVNEECLYSPERTRFIQQEIPLTNIEEILKDLFLSSGETKPINFLENADERLIKKFYVN